MCETTPAEITAGQDIYVPAIVGGIPDWGTTRQIYAARVAVDPANPDRQWVADVNGTEGLLGYITDPDEFTPVAQFTDNNPAGALITDLAADADHLYVSVGFNETAESAVYRLDANTSSFAQYTASDPERLFTGDVAHLTLTGDTLYWARLVIDEGAGTRVNAFDNGLFRFDLCRFRAGTETTLVEGIVTPDPFGWYTPFNLTVGPDGNIWTVTTTGQFFAAGPLLEGTMPLAVGGPPVTKTITRYTTTGAVVDELTMTNDTHLAVDLVPCGDNVNVALTYYEGST